jgi:hypothetical protein
MKWGVRLGCAVAARLVAQSEILTTGSCTRPKDFADNRHFRDWHIYCCANIDTRGKLIMMTRIGALRIAAAALALALSAAPVAAGPTIFGSAFVSQTGPATLYGISAATGAATPIGAIGFTAVGALDFASNGVLYGIGINQRTGQNALLTIDTATGAGTLVGDTGIVAIGTNFFQDIAFRPSDGTLFAYSASNVYTIDRTTGLATRIGFTGTGFPNGNALAFSSANTLYTGNNRDLETINQTNGLATPVVGLTYPVDDSRANGMKFDPVSGALYAGVAAGSPGNHNLVNYLATIDIGTGSVTEIGATVTGLDAIAIPPATTVAEPAPLALLGAAFAALGLIRRRGAGRPPARRAGDVRPSYSAAARTGSAGPLM